METARPIRRAAPRTLDAADIPAVVALLERVYPRHRWPDRAACESYLRETLFDNPWRDAALPSWLVEQDGRVTGFIGIVPRRMLLRERPVRAAVGCLFMVDPAARASLIALQLARAALAGPQDLFIADGANSEARRILLAAGGRAPLLYGLHWTRPLRPARYALSLLAKRGGVAGAAATLALRPAGALFDAAAARFGPTRFDASEDGIAEQPLQAAEMLAHLPGFLGDSELRPLYDARSLPWLLEQAARKTRHGALRSRSVVDGDRRLLGWYLYYARAGGASEVLHVAARPRSFAVVLRRMIVDAWQQGATALRGRLDPRHLQELSDQHCWLRREGPWTLVHSKHSEVMAAFERGSAELSRLDGEWWLRFFGG